jgi:uncharacterized protein
VPANCPRDGTELVEIERSGVRIDACRTCRGVWLDRGELEKILERESKAIDNRDHEDEEFLREVTGKSSDRPAAQRIFEEFATHKRERHGYGYGGDHHHKKRKKSFLDELFD